MKLFLFLTLLIVVSGCTHESGKRQLGGNLSFNYSKFEEITAQEFESYGVKGCFIVHDVTHDKSWVFNTERANQQFLAASTFKILHSMIALECEVVRDETEMIHWDRVQRSVGSWNEDHNMSSALKHSVVWFYREMAQRIGSERMQYWVDQVGYGNQKIGPGIDQFWLTGDLRITPLEQVQFLDKFARGQLPFAKTAIAKVKQMLIEDQDEEYTLRAKTGWADFGIPVGWYVGYLEVQDDMFIFVNNIEITENKDALARKAITREIIGKMFGINLKI